MTTGSGFIGTFRSRSRDAVREQVLVPLRKLVVQREVLQVPLRTAAKRVLDRGGVAQGEVTIVIVNWNSRPYLETCLKAVRAFTPEVVRVTVMDNHSADGSSALRGDFPRIRWIGLPVNAGHELAMDVGFLLARTEFVVALDVDAFPVAEGWIERLVDPLRHGYSVSGVHLRGGIVHPCCLAMRLDRFVTRGHTFMSRRGQRWARDAMDREAPGWDTGWRISLREEDRFLFERTEVAGPGDIGSSWDGLVYHNFYSTRFDSKLPPPQEELDMGVTPESAREAWEKAVRRYLSDLALP